MALNFRTSSCVRFCSEETTKIVAETLTLLTLINSVQTRDIVKTSGCTRGVSKIGDFAKFRGFIGIPTEQALLKNQKPPENRHKSGLF